MSSTTEITTIPKTQRAYVLPIVGGKLHLTDAHPVLQPSELAVGQCLVKLQTSGVCHSDVAISKGLMSSIPKANLIGGHEGVGVVVAIGAHTTNTTVKVGDRVGVKFAAETCLSCEMCLKGWEGHCPNMKTSGSGIDGTFSEYVVSYVSHITPIPDSLNSAEAASIMCAGVTVYSALKQSGTHIGDWVVIPGAGGGLGHLAIQYAVAMGLRVVAIDTGASKKELSLSLGAEVWVDFKESTNVVADVIAATGGGAHAAIVTAGGSGAYEVAAAYLRSRGCLMVVGLPPKAVLQVPVILLVLKGLTIQGTLVGNRQDSIEAVNIAASGKVKCRYSVRGLSELEQVYEELEKGQVVGRIVLDISK